MRCSAYLEVDDTSTVCYEEQWEGRSELESQMRGARFVQLLSLMETAREQPALEFREIARVQGLEYLAQVRQGSAP